MKPAVQRPCCMYWKITNSRVPWARMVERACSPNIRPGLTAKAFLRLPRKDKAAAADFVLGLLKEVREAHERTTRSAQRPLLRTRLKNCLFQWTGRHDST